MSVTTVNSATASTSAASSSSATSSSQNAAGSVNSTDFLQLLITELQNQDPTAPTDEKETLSQLAQFSSLEQMQNLNQNLSATTQFSQVSQSAALIGKTIASGAGDSLVTGTVSAVYVQDGKPYLQVGDQYVDASTVTEIKQQ